MQSPWIVVGAVGCALAVIAGAFGAHGLKARLAPAELALWETAARYLMYGALGLLAMGLAAQRGRPGLVDGAAWALLAGSVVFSSTVALLGLGGPRWLGAVTPLGGTLMIAGFLLFAWAMARG